MVLCDRTLSAPNPACWYPSSSRRTRRATSKERTTTRAPSGPTTRWTSGPVVASPGGVSFRTGHPPETASMKGDAIPAAPRSLPDLGAHRIQLGEERQVERSAQEVDATRPAGPPLVADGALDDLEVPEPPQLHVVLEVHELLAGLVDAPVLGRRGVHLAEDVDELRVEGVRRRVRVGRPGPPRVLGCERQLGRRVLPRLEPRAGREERADLRMLARG